MTDAMDTAHRALDGRLETTAWGLAFLVFGIFVLVPGYQEDAFLASLGAILLGLNGARAKMGLAVSWLTIVVGAAALVAGLGSIVGLAVPGLGVLFVVLGAVIAVRAVSGVRSSERPTPVAAEPPRSGASTTGRSDAAGPGWTSGRGDR
jgi:hypothetical protein